MFAKAAFSVALLLFTGFANMAEQDSTDREFFNWLMQQAGEIDFDQLPSDRAISALLTIAKGCRAMEQYALADSMRSIAINQTRRGDTTAALKTIEEIKDAETQDATRLDIAHDLCKTGRTEKGSDVKVGDDLAALYASIRCQPTLEKVIAQAQTPESKSGRIVRAIRGFASSLSG